MDWWKVFSSLFENDLHSFDKKQEKNELPKNNTCSNRIFTPKIAIKKTNTKSSHVSTNSSKNVISERNTKPCGWMVFLTSFDPSILHLIRINSLVQCRGGYHAKNGSRIVVVEVNRRLDTTMIKMCYPSWPIDTPAKEKVGPLIHLILL